MGPPGGRCPSGLAGPYLAKSAAAHPVKTSVKNCELVTCPTDAALAEQAAREWLEQLPPPSNVPYLAALSGGRIAKQFCAAIAQQGTGRNLSLVHYFWADERCVPPTDPESNFLLAQ